MIVNTFDNHLDATSLGLDNIAYLNFICHF
jgi:hypothetical protein